MSVTGGYATMSRFGGGLTAVPGTSTLDPHERARLTHRAMAVDTSHLPNDCGPMSAFGKQTESTKKNQPSFFFGRTTRAERARACNFDERSMKEALQVIEANYGRTERLVPPPARTRAKPRGTPPAPSATRGLETDASPRVCSRATPRDAAV